MEKDYSTSQAAELLNVTAKTLRNWDKDESFVPYKMDGLNRRYSREQIEKKSGKNIHQLTDPVCDLTKYEVEDLLAMAEDNKVTFDLIAAFGNTLKEKYDTLYIKMVELCTKIARQNNNKGPNFILASPEAGVLFETLAKSFSPRVMTEEMMNDYSKIYKAGSVGMRWFLYYSINVPKNIFLLGHQSDMGIIQKQENSLGIIEITGI